MKNIPLIARYVFAGLVVLLASESCSAEDYEKYVQGKPGFTLRTDNAGNSTTVLRFSGTATLSGHFVAEWRMDGKNFVDDAPVLSFQPDEASKKRLPYLVYSDNLPRKPEDLYFKNDAEAIKAILSPANYNRLKSKKVLSVEGYASVVITDYAIDHVCDGFRFGVRFVSRVSRSREVAYRTSDSQGGC